MISLNLSRIINRFTDGYKNKITVITIIRRLNLLIFTFCIYHNICYKNYTKHLSDFAERTYEIHVLYSFPAFVNILRDFSMGYRDYVF